RLDRRTAFVGGPLPATRASNRCGLPAASGRRPACRDQHALRRRMHQRTRRVRAVTPFCALARRDSLLHGEWVPDRLRGPTPARAMNRRPDLSTLFAFLSGLVFG